MSYKFRWGIDILDDGHTEIPNFFFRHYSKVLNRNEFLCILHLASYRYESESGKSCPAQSTISEQMGYKDRRSVIYLLDSIEKKGLVRIKRNPGETSEYNFEPFSRLMLQYAASEHVNPVSHVKDNSQPPVKPNSQPDVKDFSHEEEERRIKIKEDDSLSFSFKDEDKKLFDRLTSILPPATVQSYLTDAVLESDGSNYILHLRDVKVQRYIEQRLNKHFQDAIKVATGNADAVLEYAA